MRTIVLVCENLISVTKVIVLLVEQPQLPERWTRAENLFVSDFLQRNQFCIAKSASLPKGIQLGIFTKVMGPDQVG